MKNFKTIAIYGIIILLCAAVVAGYFINTGSSKAPAVSASATPTASASAVPAPSASTTPAVNTPEPSPAETSTTPDVEPIPAVVNPEALVGIGRGEDYAKVTEEAINNAGGLKDIIKKGDVVLIKPNICTLAGEGSPQITDYRTVQKLTDMAVQLGAKKVIIAEGTISGNAFSPIFLQSNKYDTIKGVELINLNALKEEDCYEIKAEGSLTGKALFIPKVYMDADKVITVAKLKTHFQPDAYVSLSLKNSIGVPPGQIYGMGSKDGLHNLGLKEAIVDINKIRKPDFAVIEGIVGGQGYGPLSNTPVKSDIIFAGRDLVALDTVALTFMGFKVDKVPHVVLAAKEKLGISDLSKIEIKGADLGAIRMKFKSALPY